MENNCKRCLLLESGKNDVSRSIKERIEKLKPDEKCGNEKYLQRLEICKNCDFLSSGTCLKCGCYPEFRAAFINQKCPCKKW